MLSNKKRYSKMKRYINKRSIATVLSIGLICATVITPMVVFANKEPETVIGVVPPPNLESLKQTTSSQPEEEVKITYWEDIPLDPELQDFIVTECEKLNIRPSIVFAMIQRESQYTADVIGDNGNSFGLMQIQAKWHYQRMIDLNCTNLLDPYQNVSVGLDLLAELIAEDKGIVWALMAYNAGASSANKMSQYSKISDYAEGVINEAERLDAYVLL